MMMMPHLYNMIMKLCVKSYMNVIYSASISNLHGSTCLSKCLSLSWVIWHLHSSTIPASDNILHDKGFPHIASHPFPEQV